MQFSLLILLRKSLPVLYRLLHFVVQLCCYVPVAHPSSWFLYFDLAICIMLFTSFSAFVFCIKQLANRLVRLCHRCYRLSSNDCVEHNTIKSARFNTFIGINNSEAIMVNSPIDQGTSKLLYFPESICISCNRDQDTVLEIVTLVHAIGIKKREL